MFLLDELPPQPAMAMAASTSNAFRVTNRCIQRLRVIVGGKRILQSSFWNVIVQQETAECFATEAGRLARPHATPPENGANGVFCPVFLAFAGIKVILLVPGAHLLRPKGAGVVDGTREHLIY